MKLISKNMPGNIHDVTETINDMPGVFAGTVIQMSYDPSARMTIVLFRVQDEKYKEAFRFLYPHAKPKAPTRTLPRGEYIGLSRTGKENKP